jgi:hypothetical protein
MAVAENNQADISALTREDASERFKSMGFETKHISGNQNCFVVSALIQLGMEISSHAIQELRLRVVRHVRANKNFAKQIKSFFFVSKTDFQTYLDHFETGLEWFCEATVLAFARAYHVDCVVLELSPTGNKPDTATIFSCQGDRSREIQKLIFTRVTDQNRGKSHFEIARLVPTVTTTLSAALDHFDKVYIDSNVFGQVARYQFVMLE